jgi:alkanesulfonate monooxygenase SsuD/methylene tetrahydromethanopterin reductase-like flavin-dependent oxidoreductase (luciferase family)
MKLDIFSEIQKRDCDANGGFARLLAESIEQAKLADELGFSCWWEVEHHCTPDFSCYPGICAMGFPVNPIAVL